MTILTWPAGVPEPKSADFWLRANTQQHVSPLSQDTQTLELAGARWRAELVFPPLVETQWRAFTAFLARLRGASGRFYYYPPYKARTPQVSAGGTPRVNGGGQVGSSLITDGWPASTTVLKAGDYFSFDNGAGGRELKIVRADATSDAGGGGYFASRYFPPRYFARRYFGGSGGGSTGAATLTFDPPIRSAPLDDSLIVTLNPSCIFRLADDDQGRLSYEEANFAGVSLSLIEEFA